MGCTVSKRKPVPTDGNAKQPESNKTNVSLKSTNSSGSGKEEAKKEEKKENVDVSEKPASCTDISRLVTEKEGKTKDPSEKKLKTLEEKSAKIPSIDLASDKKSLDNVGKTPSTELPCATPLAADQKLMPPKPDNGEYINFNDVLSDEFSEDDDKEEKKKEKKGGKKEEKKKEKEGKKEEKKEEKKEKEKEKEKEKPKEKEQKEVKPTAASAAPKQEKPKADHKSARSVSGRGDKKKKDEGIAAPAPKKNEGMKMHETKDAVKKMRTGAVRSRHAPHEDTLYQVPHRMPEVDFTKLH